MTKAGVPYGEIPGINKKVSRIFFGTASAPFAAGKAEALLDSIFDLGINAIDMARNYKGAEKSVGDWMQKRGNREDLVLLSKCAHPDIVTWRKRVTVKDIKDDLKTSLDLLQTNYLDIYLLHRDDPDVPVGEIIEIFNELYSDGKVKAFGGSNWTHERIEKANEYAYAHNLRPFVVSSPNYGLADQVNDPWGGGCITISGPSNQAARNWYIKNNMPVIAYSSLGRGLFSGKIKASDKESAADFLDEFAMKGYFSDDNFERLRRCEEMALKKNCTVPQIAMAFIKSQGINTFAVVGTAKAFRMQENIDAFSIELTIDEANYLDLK